MKERLVILGAGGYGRVVGEIAACGYNEIIFLDDAYGNIDHAIGPVSDYKKYIGDSKFFVAIGNNAIRERITEELNRNGAQLVNIVHPSAVVSKSAKLGVGIFVAPGAVLNTGAVVGNGVILNTGCSVDHDCIVEDYCHISVGSHLAGTVTVGKGTFVCAGATVINNISICESCTVGAGAVVVSDITEVGTYVGIPAKKIH